MKLKYHFCWNDEQKFYYDNRHTKKYFEYFFFHIARYWEENEVLYIFKRSKKLRKLFEEKFPYLYNEGYDFYLDNPRVVTIFKVLNKLIFEKNELGEPFGKELLRIEERIAKNKEILRRRIKKQEREKYKEFVFGDKLLRFAEKRKFIEVLKYFLKKYPKRKKEFLREFEKKVKNNEKLFEDGILELLNKIK